MGIFGWSYPPGAANDPYAPWNQVDGPCDICGQLEDYCICPECPVCSSIGDPICYEQHGLVRSLGQVVMKADMDRQIEEENKRMNEQEREWE